MLKFTRQNPCCTLGRFTSAHIVIKLSNFCYVIHRNKATFLNNNDEKKIQCLWGESSYARMKDGTRFHKCSLNLFKPYIFVILEIESEQYDNKQYLLNCASSSFFIYICVQLDWLRKAWYSESVVRSFRQFFYLSLCPSIHPSRRNGQVFLNRTVVVVQ